MYFGPRGRIAADESLSVLDCTGAIRIDIGDVVRPRRSGGNQVMSSFHRSRVRYRGVGEE
ncbi:MAG: hypothetical protein ABFC89_00520 [Methanospirillum sp.]